MAFGLIPARGPWEYRWFTVSSAATFVKGALVNLGSGYSVREYASTDSQFLGISMQSSTNSQFIQSLSSAVMVAIPYPGCTAYSDLTTGVTSATSVGQVVCLYKQGNYMSYASTVIGHASLFSALVTIAGPIQSNTSQVEVAFNMPSVVFYASASTHTFATGG